MLRKRLGSIVVLVACLVAIGFGLANPKSVLAFAIATGAISSVAASLILGLFNTRELGAQSVILERLLLLEKAADSRSKYGATLLDQKYFEKVEYWNNLSRATHSRFFLVGHALSTWLAPEYKSHFIDAIERVVRSKTGDFCMILLDPHGSAHQAIMEGRGKNYSPDIARMLQALDELRGRLPARLRHKIEVRYLPSADAPPYMAVLTDNSLEFSPYYLRESTKKAFHASFALATPFASSVESDFTRARNVCHEIDISEALLKIKSDAGLTVRANQ